MTSTIEIIDTTERLAELAPTWDRLVTRAGVTHPFVTHTWMQTWWECFGAGAELMVLLIRSDGEPIAIAPFQRRTERIYGARHRCLRFLANDHSPRCDFIIAAKPVEAYASIGKFLMSESASWDVLQLCDVPADSRTVRELTSHAAQYGFLSGVRRGPNSPVAPTTSRWDEYFETLPSKRRWFLRNRLKRLSKSGRVSLETITGGPELLNDLEDGYRLEAAAWKGNAGTAIVCRPDVRRFYTTLAERAAQRGWLRLHFLKLDERRIAFAYCLAYNDRMFLLKPGFDPEYGAFSPGNLLSYLALQEVHASNCVAYEFLGYDDPWKRVWSDQSIGHSTLFLYARQPLTRLDHYTRFALMPRLRRARDLVFREQH
jgi:CelD/BcsL family acetyltransferase involved in cellulose biosynthesis